MLFTHTAEKRYMVGIDLGEDSCQISWSDMGSDPKTLSYTEGSDDFAIPMTLLKKRGTNLWYCGRDAVQHAGYNEGELVTGILSAAAEGRGVEIEGQEYDPRSLLALYIRRVLAVFAGTIPTEKISGITFTSGVMDESLVEALRRVREYLSLPIEYVSWENHGNSFYSYMARQSRQLWEKDVLLCEYDGQHSMHISRLVFNRSTTPVVAFLKEHDYPEMGAVSLREEAETPEKAGDLMDSRFLEILKGEAPEGEISSIYLIGEGWSQQWMKKSLRYAGFHRRIFLGSNLFSKGASYSALSHKSQPENMGGFFFLGENKLTSNIGMMVLEKGKNTYMPVLNAGTDWYETSAETEILLAGGSEISLVFTPLTGAGVKEESIQLEDLPERPPRMTRLRLVFSLTGPRDLLLEVEDLGFGTFYQASGKTWEKKVHFDDGGNL